MLTTTTTTGTTKTTLISGKKPKRFYNI